jgi:hypothetical protein
VPAAHPRRLDETRTPQPLPHAIEEPFTSAEDPGYQDEDAEVQEGRTGSQPSEEDEPIVHGTAPASSLPTDPQDNEPQVPEVPASANDNPAPSELPAAGTD